MILNREHLLFRCKKQHNPKNVGVLSAGDGDGTAFTRMDKLEEALAARPANMKKYFNGKRQRGKGRKKN